MPLSAWDIGKKEHDKREFLVIIALKKNMKGRRLFTNSQQKDAKTQVCQFHEDIAYLKIAVE